MNHHHPLENTVNIYPINTHAVVFCADCEYATSGPNLLGLPHVVCRHPLSLDPVTAEPRHSARTMRRLGRACGPSGGLWQPAFPDDEDDEKSDHGTSSSPVETARGDERPGDLEHLYRLAEEISASRRL